MSRSALLSAARYLEGYGNGDTLPECNEEGECYACAANSDLECTVRELQAMAKAPDRSEELLAMLAVVTAEGRGKIPEKLYFAALELIAKAAAHK